MQTMIDIPTAEEAQKESTYRAKANEILSSIAKDIKKQTANGFFSCAYQVSSSFVNECRGGIDLAIEDLKKLGYDAELEIDKGPSFEHYWDCIKIRWDKKFVKEE